MRREMLFFKCLLFLILGIDLFAQKSYFVSPYGSNNNDGSIGRPWQTINSGLGKIFPGDTLNIMEGTYYELLNNFVRTGQPDKMITIRNYRTDKAIINGNGQWTVIDFKGKSYYHFKGLEITNGVWAGFNGTNYHHCVISECIIHGIGPSSGTAAGLYVSGTPGLPDSSTHNVIERNTIYDCYGEGIYIGNDGHSLPPNGSSCNDNILRFNEIFRCVDGIDIKTGSKRTLVKGNRIHDCNGGEYSAAIIVFEQALIDSNILHNNVNYGLFVQGNENRICRNQVTKNRNYGIHVTGYESMWNNYKDSGDSNTIDQNTVAWNGNWGIYLWGDVGQDSRNNVFRNNLVCFNTGYQLVVYPEACHGLVLESNNWYTNTYPLIRYNNQDCSSIADLDRWYGKSSGSFQVDPGFINVDQNDFNLNTVSPVIDRGSTGEFPFWGLAPDIGAAEFIPVYFPTDGETASPVKDQVLVAFVTMENRCTFQTKSIIVRVETSIPVIQIPTTLLFRESDGTETGIVLEGTVPGSLFYGSIPIGPSVSEGPGDFVFKTSCLLDAQGNTSAAIQGVPSFIVDKTPPPSPSRLGFRE